MASFTLLGGDRFPDGTTVSVYPTPVLPSSGGTPTGSAVTTATISSGQAVVSGLANAARYVAYAQVNGQDRYKNFQTDVVSSSGNQFLPFLGGVNAWLFSHSYGNVQATANCSPGALYRARFVARQRINTLVNAANNGYSTEDVIGTLIGGGATGQAWTVTNRGVVIVDCIQNNLRLYGSSAQAQTSFTNAVRAGLWRLLCDTLVEDTAAGFSAVTGTWAASTHSWYSGGQVKFDGAANARADLTFTVPAGRTDAVLFQWSPGSGTSVPDHELWMDGAKVGGTRNLTNQGPPSASDSAQATNQAPVATPFLGIGAGSHTVSLRKITTDALNVNLDCVMVPRLDAPTVVLMKQAKMTSALYTQVNAQASDALVDTYNGILDTLAAEHPGVVVTADPNLYGWDPTTMWFNGSPGVHPNDKGMAVFADAIDAALAPVGYRLGQNTGV